MDKSRLEWRVGIFVFIGLVVLAVLFLLLSKGASPFRPAYNLHLTAKNVGGLKTRSFVLMAGVQVGTVSGIRLNPSGTNVTILLRLYKDYPIHKDARFVIEQSGFLGDQYVSIVPADNLGPVFGPEEYASAQEPFNLQDVARSASGFIQRIDQTAKNLNDSISDVRRLLLNQETLTNVAAAVWNMRVVSERALSTVNELDALIATNRPPVSSAASNLLLFSREMNGLGDQLSDLLATNGPGVSSAVSNIDASTAALRSILDNAEAGKGLVGTLMRSEQFAGDVSGIARNLSITTSNLNRLGLWGILWSKKSPRTNQPPGTILKTPKHQPD